VLAARIFIDETRDTSREQRLDLPGLIASAVGLFALTYGLIETNDHAWGSTRPPPIGDVGENGKATRHRAHPLCRQSARDSSNTPAGAELVMRFVGGRPRSRLPRFVRHLDDGREPRNVTVNGPEGQTEEFERQRRHLHAVAYRMLGSLSDADDVVQEAWLRLHRSDPELVENMRGWLTTVVARLCLDELRARQSRREDYVGSWLPEPVVTLERDDDPQREALLADSVGLALLVVLETLAPAERLAFVLHDMFALPFAEIAPIIGRTPVATRQLASRARRRVGGAAPNAHADLSEQRAVIEAFLAAAREGDFAALVAVLHPDVVFRADRGRLPAAKRLPGLVRGAAEVAEQVLTHGAAFLPRCRPAIVNGAAGLVVAPRRRPVGVVGFTIADGRITELDLIVDPQKLRLTAPNREERTMEERWPRS
jgi:RNA polymerase sigma factor (sigma-70 family)